MSFKKGSLLIEVLFATAVIGIALLPLFMGLTSTFGLFRRGRNLTTAYQAANQEMEILRNLPFGSLTNRDEESFSVPGLSRLPQGQGWLSIRDFEGDVSLKELEIKIRWTEKGSPRDIRVSSLATSGGLSR